METLCGNGLVFLFTAFFFQDTFLILHTMGERIYTQTHILVARIEYYSQIPGG